MIRIRLFGLAAGTVAALLVSVAALPAAAESMKITVAVGDAYPPWVAQELENGGYATHLVELATKRAGHTVVETVWVPWARAYELTKTGEADVTMPWVYTEERAVDFLYTKPIIVLNTYVYTKAGAPTMATKDDMRGKRLCLPNAYSTSGPLKELMDEGALTRQSPPDMASCFRMLNGGRVDFISIAETEAPGAIAESGIDPANIARGAQPLNQQELSIIVGRKNPNAEKIVTFLDDQIAAMEQDGTLADLRARYD